MAKGKNQYQLNKDIENLIDLMDMENKSYSKKDIEFINQYTGSGGLAKFGAKGRGILHEFYTPDYVCELMWKLAFLYGYDNGTVLEPSCATGRLLADAPDKSKCYGFEINHYSKRIAELTYPGAIIYENYFETAFLSWDRFTSKLRGELTWLDGYPFSLIIGNPPYGKYYNKYSHFFKNDKIAQIEQFFFLYGLKLLKKDGIMIYLVSSNLIRSGMTYQVLKQQLESISDLVDAYRLPAVFDYSTVPTDIIILRKK